MTRQAQRMNNWLSSHLGGMFFMLEVVFNEQTSLHNEILQTLNEITHKLDELDHSIESCIDHQNTESLPSVSYNSQKEITLNCTTPQAQCCAQLLVHFDQLIQQYDRLWLLNEIDRKEYQKAIRHWTLSVSRTLNECHQCYRHLRQRIIAQNQFSDNAPPEK